MKNTSRPSGGRPQHLSEHPKETRAGGQLLFSRIGQAGDGSGGRGEGAWRGLTASGGGEVKRPHHPQQVIVIYGVRQYLSPPS